MSALQTQTQLPTTVLEHLEDQLDSAGRLLSIVLDQGAAIRVRDVHRVVECTGLMQAELTRRAALEAERAVLLAQAGALLSIDPGSVTLELICGLLDSDAADLARSRSAHLRGVLAEIKQEHHTNRALMNQELAFLDHLLRLVDVDHQVGYDAAGDPARRHPAGLTTRPRVLDLEV